VLLIVAVTIQVKVSVQQVFDAHAGGEDIIGPGDAREGIISPPALSNRLRKSL
jgi:hypothetical protein